MTPLAQLLFIDKQVRHLKLHEPLMVEQHEPVITAIKTFKTHGIGSVIVVDEFEIVVGILTERDILRKVIFQDIDLITTSVSKFMTPNPTVVKHTSSLARAIHEMAINNIRHLPIVKTTTTPLGLISAKDIVDYSFQIMSRVSETSKGGKTSEIVHFLNEPVSLLKPKKPFTLDTKARVVDAIKSMQDHKVGSILITDKKKLVGILTERDLVKQGIVSLKEDDGMLVDEIMTRNPVYAVYSAKVGDVFETMSVGKYRHIPILNPDMEITGILSVRDFMRVLAGDIISELRHE